MYTKSLAGEKSFAFAVKIVGLYQQMTQKREYVVSRQLLKSGTSIGANIQEALAGQSRRDFLSKMAIASKEARETRYWLRLIKASNLFPGDLTEISDETEELIRMLTAIVKTTGRITEKLKTQN